MSIFKKECKYCKKVFIKKRQSNKPPTYCSHECYSKDKRKISVEYTLDCLYCGKTFTEVRPNHLPPPKFCSHLCYGLNKRQPFILKNGYVLIRKPGHLRADKQGRVREHLLVMEEKIGRPILKTESVHHIDGNKTNNHPDNLGLFATHSEHLLHEWANGTLRKVNLGKHHPSYKTSVSTDTPLSAKE